jgi:hypothetical protein
MNRSVKSSKLGPSVVDQVRSIRSEIDQEVGHDIHKLAERARRIGAQFRRQIKAKASRNHRSA